MTKLQYPLCGPQVCLQRAACGPRATFDMPALECTHREVTFVLWNLGMLNLTWKFNV